MSHELDAVSITEKVTLKKFDGEFTPDAVPVEVIEQEATYLLGELRGDPRYDQTKSVVEKLIGQS